MKQKKLPKHLQNLGLEDKFFFSVSRLHRQDIIGLLDNRAKTREKVSAISDEDMEAIANRMGEEYMDSGNYWDSLERAIKDYFKKGWSCFQCNFSGTEKQVEDHKCPAEKKGQKHE